MIRDSGIENIRDVSEIKYIDSDGRIYGLDYSGYTVIVDDGVITRIDEFITGGERWRVIIVGANDPGQILGYACRNDECGYNVLFSPLPIPEPTMYGMFQVGG